MLDMVILLESIEIGKTKNHLIFKGFVPSLFNDRVYTFDYTGADVTTDEYMPDGTLHELKNLLNADFGYPSFNISVCKKIFGGSKRYEF
jgi:hypothetical protein